MKELFRTLPLMCIVLLVPVLPFVFFGSQLEVWFQGLAEDPPSGMLTAWLVVGLLATDIFLPVPSSLVCTLSGWQLGWWQGMLASWIGMNLGAVFGFWFARRWGRSFAVWFSKPRDLERMRRVILRFGPMVLVLTRAMPVLAEAGVLISGIHRLSWRRFLPAVVFSNLGIAIAYGLFGHYASEHEWLPLALSVAVAVPVLFAAIGQQYLSSVDDDSADATDA